MFETIKNFFTGNSAASNSAPEHPGGLSTMGRAWEKIKYVGGKALKWGAIGAAAGAVLFSIPGLGAGGLLASVSGGHLGTGLMGAGIDAAITGATYIGGLAAAVSLPFALSGMGEAADAANEQAIFNFNRNQAYTAQQQMMQQRYQQTASAMGQQAQGLGISPNNVGMGFAGNQQAR